MKSATITEDTIRQLVNAFYAKVRHDTRLGPVFNEAIGHTDAEWQTHLEILYAFWSSVMLGTAQYRGNPFQKHKNLPDFDRTLFARWLELFEETAHEVHTPDIAELYAVRSRQIANSLKYGLFGE